MDYIVNQFSDPEFAYKLFQFFFVASIAVLCFGIALVWRSAIALRFMSWMSTWISTRKLMRPAEMPHFVEPTMMKRPVLLGVVAALIALASMLVLLGTEAEVIRRLLFDVFPRRLGGMLADVTRTLLLVANAFGIGMGLLLIFSPGIFSNVEAYSDRWFSLRKASYPLEKMHVPLDGWVSANPTISGIVLIVVALSLGVAAYVEMAAMLRLL